MSKKAILAVSFGTTYKETRAKTIDATVSAIAQAFPDYVVRQAFTSTVVIKRINEQEGLHIDTPAEALQKLASAGFKEVYVQSLHFLPGIEYELLEKIVAEHQTDFEILKVTQPLLVNFADFEQITEFLQAPGLKLKPNEAILWMGHGSSHSSFTTYACLDHMLEGTPSYVGAVESYPDIQRAIAKLNADGVKRVCLHPLMLVAGNHAHNDMASTEPDSWKSLLEQNQMMVEPILKGLGEYPQIQTMFINKLQRLVEE